MWNQYTTDRKISKLKFMLVWKSNQNLVTGVSTNCVRVCLLHQTCWLNKPCLLTYGRGTTQKLLTWEWFESWCNPQSEWSSQPPGPKWRPSCWQHSGPRSWLLLYVAGCRPQPSYPRSEPSLSATVESGQENGHIIHTRFSNTSVCIFTTLCTQNRAQQNSAVYQLRIITKRRGEFPNRSYFHLIWTTNNHEVKPIQKMQVLHIIIVTSALINC